MNTASASASGRRFITLDTAAAPPRERFELWRILFPQADIAPLDSFGAGCASATVYAGGGASLAHVRIGPTLTRHAEDRSGQFMLNLFLGGHSTVSDGRHETFVDAGSGFSLSDCTRPTRSLAREGNESIHLFLPRERVTWLLGRNPTGNRPWRHLPATPLGEVLKANLLALARHGTALDAPAAARCMEATASLALACLAQFGAPDTNTLLFDGACRYIDAHLHDSQLSADSVAQALHCSRTRLYRVFAERELSVAAYARDRRLRHGRRLLRDTSMSIGEVALCCGYGDPPAFGKAFRRHFGMAPGEWRMMTALRS